VLSASASGRRSRTHAGIASGAAVAGGGGSPAQAAAVTSAKAEDDARRRLLVFNPIDFDPIIASIAVLALSRT
jgi:hypothetical protein